MASAPASTATTAPPQPTITFVIRPQPVTMWFQFQDGSRLGVSPAPVSPILSLGGLPFVMMPGLFGGSSGTGGVERQLHELFQRALNEQHGPPPTSKTFLDKIPLKTWTETMKQNEKHTDCPICLCDYEENDQVLPLPCGHQFHKDCGMKWLLEHNVCPTCRHALPTQDSDTTKPETTPAPAAPAIDTSTVEPEAEDDVARHAPRVRQRSPRHEPERLVRRRINEMESLVLSTPSQSEEEAMDSILEEEASRFIAEEQEKQRMSEVTFNDGDVEELLHDMCN